MRLFLILLTVAPLAFGQLSVGIKAGVPLTDTLDVANSVTNGYTTNTKRYTVGPMVELRLPWGLGVEVDALYKNVNYNGLTTGSTSSTTGSAWQFPVIAKKRFSGGAIRPYIGAGPSFQHLFSLKQVTTFFTGGATTTTTGDPKEINDRSGIGGALEGGFELHIGPLKLSPEVRYTRWGSPTFLSTFRQGVDLNRNQAEFLLGIAF
jgi:outer membrane protein W